MRIISGIYKGRSVVCPKHALTRPTSSRLREAVFNICQSLVAESSFLDLFAGSGAMGLEALSRGAKDATFIEKDPSAVKCIKQNIDTLRVKDQSFVLQGDVLQMMHMLEKQNKQYSIIYIDPPYLSEIKTHQGPVLYSLALLELIDQTSLLAPSGVLFIEDATKIDSNHLNLSNLKLSTSRSFGNSNLLEYRKH